MKKAIITLLVCFFAGLCLSFFMDEDQRRRKLVDNRVAVERVLEAYNLKFNKDIGESSIIFQLVPGDSIKIECSDCPTLMAEDKGNLSMTIQSIDGVMPLNPNSFDRWLKIKSSNGKIGVVFKRDGLGEKNLLVSSMRMWRKTKRPQRDEAGVPVSLLDLNNIYIDKLSKDDTQEQMTFFSKMKSEDKVTVTIKGANGAVPANLICQVYKQGEEFDKSPIEVGPPFDVPKVDGGSDRFAFEFSHIKDVKGVNTYHVDIERIPARSAFIPTEPEILDTESVATDLDSLNDGPEEDDPLKALLEKFIGGPKFQCETPEQDISVSLFGRLNIGPGKSNRKCIDLLLTDECVAAEPCPGCDSLWAFWIGAGDDMVNRFMYADSVRKSAGTGEGVVKSFARGRYFRKTTGNTVFPGDATGENVFFAIVDNYRKEEFLSQPLDVDAWLGDGVYTYSAYDYVTSSQYILKYDPNRPMSLCICNDNSVSSIPIFFRFQQFLTEPIPVDSTQLLEEALYYGGDTGFE
ncbi:MAG: hypothetical protein AAGN35_12545 [Bacteroidota bacterium]